MDHKDPEKTSDVSETPFEVNEKSKAEARRASIVGEASDLYGNEEDAEKYGYVSRGYVPKLHCSLCHLWMAAFAMRLIVYTDSRQSQVTSYPIYCSRGNHRHWPVFRYRP